ncbi:hypothetical protein [Nonomuraea sp. B5E05]|uniref:hypothetical protein n=1 Tax=Nonomuraea sp. B5E05 TaxID=3153569 RepID=UPI00325FF018
MDLTPEELPELWRPPIVEHSATIRAGERRYLLAWGDDARGARWGFLLEPPQSRGRRARWVHWGEIRPVAGEDYSAVPVTDPLL